MSRYLIVIEREGASWGAYAPDLPGIGVVASTREEVEKLAVEAISQHVALLRELGQPVPVPQAEVAYTSVA